MSEVRAVVSVPTADNFGGFGAVTPCAPLLVDTNNGQIYSMTAAGTVVESVLGSSLTAHVTAIGTAVHGLGSMSTQSTTSPTILTSLLTTSTTFTAFAGATVLLTLGGTGATSVVAIPGTKASTVSTDGSVTLAGGMGVAGNSNFGGTLGVTGAFTALTSIALTKSQNAGTNATITNVNTGSSTSAGYALTVNGTNTNASLSATGSGTGSATIFGTALTTRILSDSGMTGGLVIAARGASADVKIMAGGIADADLVATFADDLSTTLAGAFGCNTKAAQTAYASGGALNAYGAGANGLDSGANMSALHALVVKLRAALVANGIMS